MKHFQLASVTARIALGLTLLLLAGCFGGGGAGLDDSSESAGNAPVIEQQQDQLPAAEARNTLRTLMPALTKLSPGSEFEFVLSGDFADPLFQASARVLYDSRVVQLVDSQRGGLVPADAVCVLRDDLAPGALELSAGQSASGYDSVVPFAYTQLPQTRAEAGKSGELLRLRFRLVGQARMGQPAVSLQNDQAFLQLRDSAGQRLSFDLEARENSSEVAR